MSYYHFEAPPLPSYYICGEQIIKKGDAHAARSNIGVFDLLIVLEGSLYMGEEDRQWELQQWDMLLLRPDAHHYPFAPCREEGRFFWMHFQAGSRWSEAEAQYPEKPLPIDRSHAEHFGTTYSLYFPKYWSIRRKGEVEKEMNALLTSNSRTSMMNCWEQQAAFHRMLRIISQETHEMRASAGLHLVERVTEYLRNRYKQAITNETLADEFHFHAVYMTRTMQRHQGCTPLQYLMKVRIEQAKLRLVNTDSSIAMIAEDVGFESNTYFTRCFQKMEHKTPSEYRNQFRV
ncbi:AraC family transcriptional regulator [Paenibacillus sacheonensis]|uniref:Helix-turn-helix domain-containing protein n=1 Tax=Paenibacillus sacheonensis TaxID=742054 RepID=A0A7X5C1B3_9BACL|nr:AraC family transcriptional regulator [Paenibacillus sacheonensis]MBM7565140.1 AraC-like DNA-binding protein [Paenibacillus sacheonensis]NBC70080.1 helix-turn-helix domain-containing protein [Paenibacillus sacheonensis]